MQKYVAKLVSKQSETHNVATLYLKVDGEFKYKPGLAINLDAHQFPELHAQLSEKERITGKREFPRAFSLSSAPHDDNISITVKVEKPRDSFKPILAPYLVYEIKEGAEIAFYGPFGTYHLPGDFKDKRAIVYINAGSGIAPSHGIWNYLLKERPDIKQHLFYQLQTFGDIIYKDEIYKLTHGNVLDSKIYLSRDKWHDEICRNGYVDCEDVKKLQEKFSSEETLYFICGPNKDTLERKGFVNFYVDILKGIAVSPNNIIYEIW